MFIIVPKRGQRGAARAPAPGPENTAAVSVSQGDAVTSTATATATSTGTAPPAQVGDKKNADVHDSDAGPVRSTTACDACRVRKVSHSHVFPRNTRHQARAQADLEIWADFFSPIDEM